MECYLHHGQPLLHQRQEQHHELHCPSRLQELVCRQHPERYPGLRVLQLPMPVAGLRVLQLPMPVAVSD